MSKRAHNPSIPASTDSNLSKRIRPDQGQNEKQPIDWTKVPRSFLSKVIYRYIAEASRGCTTCSEKNAIETPQSYPTLCAMFGLAIKSKDLFEFVSSHLVDDVLWREIGTIFWNEDVITQLKLRQSNLDNISPISMWYAFAGNNIKCMDLTSFSPSQTIDILRAVTPFEPKLETLYIRGSSPQIELQNCNASTLPSLFERILKSSESSLQTFGFSSEFILLDVVLKMKLTSLKSLTLIPSVNTPYHPEYLWVILRHFRKTGVNLIELKLVNVNSAGWQTSSLRILGPTITKLHLLEDYEHPNYNPLTSHDQKHSSSVVYSLQNVRNSLYNLTELTLHHPSALMVLSIIYSQKIQLCPKLTRIDLVCNSFSLQNTFQCLAEPFAVFGNLIRKLYINQDCNLPKLSEYQVYVLMDFCPNLEVLSLSVPFQSVENLSRLIQTSKSLKEIYIEDIYHPGEEMEKFSKQLKYAFCESSAKIERIKQTKYPVTTADIIAILKKFGHGLKCLHMIGHSEEKNHALDRENPEITIADGVKIFETAQNYCINIENIEVGKFEGSCNKSVRIETGLMGFGGQETITNCEPPETIKTVMLETAKKLPNFKNKSMEWVRK